MSERTTYRLGALLQRSEETLIPSENAEYQEITIKLWGKGVVLRGCVKGSEISSQRRFFARQGQFILSRIDARNGAMGIVPDSLNGAIVSNDFPIFGIAEDRLVPSYLEWLSKTPAFVEQCRNASEGTTNRIRLKEQRFLEIALSLPCVREQQRTVETIDQAARKLQEADSIESKADDDLSALLMSTYRTIINGAPRRHMGEIAPLNRRPAVVEEGRTYPQVSARSFGRGTFHKPALSGSEITWQKPFLVKSGDILISNIKAWEGAIAVATPSDNDRYGSHRYLTCVPVPSLATARFVCFHLLTAEGLADVGEASPGTADRNRTLNAKALLNILVPVPPFEQQQWFDAVYAEVDRLRKAQVEAKADRQALLQAILSKAFSSVVQNQGNRA